MASVISKSNQPELNRRSVLGAATGAAATVAASSVPQPVSAGTLPSEIVMMDAIMLAAMIRSRQASCVDVMTAYLDHIEKLNPKVNAIVALQDRAGLLAQSRERDAQLARGELMGPLHGFPHAVKDLVPVKGIPMTMGVNAGAIMHRLAGAKIHQRCWQEGPRTGSLFFRHQA